jgi:DNA polymerase III subunit delta'
MLFAHIPVDHRIKERLIQLSQSGKIPHALLLSGKPGSGNLALALAFAQHVMCDSPTETDSCGQCPHCTKIQKNVHPDIFFSFPFITDKNRQLCSDFMEEWRGLLHQNPYPSVRDWQELLAAENKSLNIYISELRDITKRLSMKSYSGKKKILIMWLPEFMGKEGNVLLKLIEEPPENTLFLLVTEHEKAILNTILSRTQRIQIQSPSVAQIQAFIMQMDPEMSEDKAATLATLSHGNISLSLQLMQDLDESLFDTFVSFMRNAYASDYQKLFSIIDVISQKGRETASHFFKYTLEVIRKSFLFSQLSTKQDLTEKEKAFVLKFAETMRGKSYEHLYNICNDTIKGLEQNGNVKLLMIDAALRIKNVMKI